MNSHSIKELNNSFRSNKNSDIKYDIISPKRNIVNRNNLENLSCQNTENILFSENYYTKYSTNKNYSNKLTHSTSSKISNISKSNRINNNINKPNLDLGQKNKYYIEHIPKKINQTKIPTSTNKNLEEKENNIIKSQKKILNLNKKIKRERYSNKNYINIPKSINNKKEENKYILLNSYSNKNDISYKENKDNKSLSYNYSHEKLKKVFSCKDIYKNNCVQNNNEISNILKPQNKKEYIFSQYYSNIDISSYNKNNLKENKNIDSNEIYDDSKILKKEIHINNPGKNEYIINTYIYNTPIEQHNIINNKNYINSENNKIFLSPKNKKNEKIKNDNPKSFISFMKIKNDKIYKSVNKKNSNDDLNKKNEINSNIKIKKDIFYYLNPNIYKDELSFQKIKKNARTTKVTLEENDLDNKSQKIPINLNKNKLIKKNKNEILKYQKIFETKIDKCKQNHLNEFDSEEIDELKISGIHPNKKILENKFNNGSLKKNQNLYKYYDINDIVNNSKNIKDKYMNNDIRSVCVINTRKNMNNNVIKISNLNKSPGNKISKNVQMVICKTDSGKKNINLSSRDALNKGKYDILNLKNSRIKKSTIYLDDVDKYDTLNIEKKDIKIIPNNRYLTDNNKSIINIRSNAPNTLFKSVKTGKSINDNVKLNQSGKGKEENSEFISGNSTLKKINLYNNIKEDNNYNIINENKVNQNNKSNKNNNLNTKVVYTNNHSKNTNLFDNQNKEKNDIIKSKKKLSNNYSENFIFEKSKNNINKNLNKKKSNKDINNIKCNIESSKINKYISEISTIEPIKNQINNEHNSYSNKKLNVQINKNQNNNVINKIYIKPNFPSPKSKRQYQTERRLDNQKVISSRNLNNNIIFNSKNNNHIRTSSNQISHINQNIFITSSPTLKSHKSSKLIKFNVQKENLNQDKKISEDIIDENKLREKYFRKYCFIKKYIDYFIKRPIIYECYFTKILKKTPQQINIEYFNQKNEDFNLNNNDNNDLNKTLSIKNLTFFDNKKSIEKTSSKTNDNNNIKNEQKEISNNIINEVNQEGEGKLDIYKKLDQIEFLDDNFIDNEDIKLNYSDENNSEENSVKLYGITLGKEIEDSEKKVSKTYKNIKLYNNLEKAEKGLKILRNLAERRELNSSEDINQINNNKNNINQENIINNKNQKIYLGTNKLTELFNKRKDTGKLLTEGNLSSKNNEQIRITKYRFSKSLNKDSIIKGISKIENLLEKKSYEKYNNKINTYQKKGKKINMSIDTSKEHNFETEQKLNNYNRVKIHESMKEIQEEQKKLINNINIIKNIEGEKSQENSLSLKNNNIFRKQNSIKSEILYFLNIITEVNYQNMIDKLTQIIVEKNSDDEILKKENIFKNIIFNKFFSEKKFVKLYSKLTRDLNENILLKIKEQKNIRNVKEITLKNLINNECINLLNNYKNQNQVIINDYDSDNYYSFRNILRAYVSFIYELISVGILKQQFGINIIEQFYKKRNETNINIIYQSIYLDAAIILFDKLLDDIFKSENQKLIQCLNNFKDSLSKDDNNELPIYLRYKIINSIEKKKNIYDKKFDKKLNSLDLFDKVLEEEMANKTKINKESINPKNNKINPKDEYELIIQEDLINYISYFSEKGNNDETIIKSEIDKSYNWKAIDDLINEKNHGLGFIIKKFIRACADIITKESQVLLSNDYIKSIIEYYINNLSKEEIEIVQNDMIKSFQDINNIINTNQYMCKILGNLLFLLIENKLYHIKDFNNYLKEDKNTKINLAIITKYCIISSGKFAKKYFNDFKQTKLFINNNNIFNEYVSNSLKDLFYFFK